MRTDFARPSVPPRHPSPVDAPLLRTALFVLLALAFASAAPLAAQEINASPETSAARDSAEEAGAGRLGVDTSPLFIDPGATVRRVRFRFVEGSELSESQLRNNIAYQGPGALTGLRDALDFLPGISSPARESFSPLTLQRDLARLRNVYLRSGFPSVEADYETAYDPEENEVSITFVIAQGEPLLIDTVGVDLVGAADDAIESESLLAPELRDEWRDYVADLAGARGTRYGQQERRRILSEAVDWMVRRGYPWADARVAVADTTESGVAVRLELSPGARARVETIELQGQQRLTQDVVRREIPLEVGDWYDAGDVVTGESELYELDLVRRALGEIPEDQPHDNTVRVRYRIEEARPRLVTARVGWRSESGFATEAHWSHRDFLGGARTFTTSLTVETGWAALEQARGRSAGLSASLRQPYVWHRSLSATFGPFVRVRDDFRDRSILYGVETALIYRRGPLETVTLQHEFSRLRVDEGFQLLPIRERLTTGERPFEPVFVRSVFKLSGSYGRLDDRLDPHSGFMVEPNVELAGPGPLTDIEFFRVGIDGMAAIPLDRRVGIYLSASAGRMVPFGRSRPPGAADQTRAVIGLRGVMFTAGGTSDVRGWGAGALGPKIPDISVKDGVVQSDRYVPVGGLARLTGSVELGLPFPFIPAPHGTFLFLDVGRIWTPGDRFQPGDPELALEPWGVGVGGGLQFGTPVGPIRLSVGYKLNPTRVDLLSPEAVARALAAGDDLSGLKTEEIRRWHLHLSIGRGL